MKQKAVPVKQPAEEVIRDIRREIRRHFSAKKKFALFSMALAVRRASLGSTAGYPWI